MSILIKGMKMPDKCGHCRFATALECEVTKNFITTFNVRQQDCPLVPVQPHGRLIDADALYRLVQKRTRNWAGGWNDIVCAFTGNDIKDAPTIIPAEEDE